MVDVLLHTATISSVSLSVKTGLIVEVCVHDPTRIANCINPCYLCASTTRVITCDSFKQLSLPLFLLLEPRPVRCSISNNPRPGSEHLSSPPNPRIRRRPRRCLLPESWAVEDECCHCIICGRCSTASSPRSRTHPMRLRCGFAMVGDLQDSNGQHRRSLGAGTLERQASPDSPELRVLAGWVWNGNLLTDEAETAALVSRYID